MYARARRLLPMLALCVLFVAPAQAQRRRAVRSPGPATPVTTCHTFSFVRAGLKATYATTAQSGNANFTVTYIFDNATQTKTTQVVTTSQGTSDVETILDTEIFGNLRGLKHLNVKASQTVPVLGRITIETDIDFVPSLTSGPAAGWCVGNTWSIPAVTETITTKGPVPLPPQIITTIAATGEVLAVGETISVPAGSFNTVKNRSAIVSGTSVETAITWISMQHNIVVRQDTIDGNGAVTTTNLTALQ